jgi:cyclohexadienyl dehydratase
MKNALLIVLCVLSLMAFMVPRGDVTFQQYVNQFLHLSKANGDYQAVIDKWLK